jgi:hypothetical protein
MTYGPNGLDVELTVPLTHERWPDGGSAPLAQSSP